MQPRLVTQTTDYTYLCNSAFCYPHHPAQLSTESSPTWIPSTIVRIPHQSDHTPFIRTVSIVILIHTAASAGRMSIPTHSCRK